MNFNIKLPIKESRSSDNYALILVDSANITHYLNFDGSYDGYSSCLMLKNKSSVNPNVESENK